MTNVPTPLQLVAGAVGLAAIGVAITLVPRSASQPTRYLADTNSVAAAVTPLLAGQGVVENPPVSVSVNGQAIPAKSGTIPVTTPGGSTTVQIAGTSVTVTSQSAPASSAPSGSLNVAVNSSSNGNIQSHSSVVTSTSGAADVSHSSTETISGSGQSVVTVQTTTGN